MNRGIKFAEGEYYHIYNRGVEKRKVFLNLQDWKRFQTLLYLCNGTKPFAFKDLNIKKQKISRGSTSGEIQNLFSVDVGEKIVAIGAYVLMPNHFHIIIKEIKENGITEFMRKLLTAYSMYFNKRHERVGPLFQGTFKAKHLDYDQYLKYQFAYIHLNPIKLIEPKWKETGIKNLRRASSYLKEYTFSSYHDYGGITREEIVILNKDEFPVYFKNQYSFKGFLKDWLNFADSP
ncbi:MAG: hypothetical protein COV95_01700 [Candidatus Zambryskibacteria bacterium CG11_big_fil_rev_8_21_14_0_20_40_24]|uniref:Transposase IS200-like domain-containing protein n=1 Tax=Candidatus Zambryskibacteria bacterium CG11_big_fil_rev_8_21_14_0_20_40_24 TaxID=1975116 RepID=A0A2H0K6K1_9BACT|nr:MAG: hypothetical protein COV95_01700 [Candidatus Zambryskibacteria bacterium CG11_big_fil_rev_8_21_14_0_20_40_24]